LANGLLALEEAGDFQPRGTRLEAELDLAAVVSTHRTSILQTGDLDGWTAVSAMQYYHAYAEQQLRQAGGQEMAAADALYGLARLQPYLRTNTNDPHSRSGPIAMSLYRSALDIQPDHYLAANELGTLFVQYGQWQEARDVFQHAVRIRPECPILWENLARIHDQLGERDLAQLALHEWQVALRWTETPAKNSRSPQVRWVDPATFARRPRNEQADVNSAALRNENRSAAVRAEPTAPTHVDDERLVPLPSHEVEPRSLGQRPLPHTAPRRY
jgi:tetratricopeptide (TPR) repeat protein